MNLCRPRPARAGSGGRAALDLVTEALVPPVEHRLPVDPAHRMNLGQSFGGAFVLEARMRQAGVPRMGRRAARRSGAISTHGSSLPSVLCRAAAFLWLAAASDADQ
jgi:predicted alpha/beta superfamily hydrolase